MTGLELLAPARNTDIGIAAIDCGADAVYIAGPAFGARKDAGNSIDELRRLCNYAHKFGARVFVTFNTIVYDEELESAERLLGEIAGTGVDALIVQDLGVVSIAEDMFPEMILHASTQCAIRTPEDAAFYESQGFGRLVLERELSLEDIRSIRKSVSCELECFVHGALCVCYSGQCYLSEQISGRSANRGACIQACRSRYDLVNSHGDTLVKNKSLLSLKDYNLKDRLEEMADAGVCSFKIEGRLKNISYVRNVVREYSMALDSLVAKNPGKYCRASHGRVTEGFQPDTNKTFNRGYTSLYIDGKRSMSWAATDAAKSMGELIGKVTSVRKCGRDEMDITVSPIGAAKLNLANGDGFSFISGSGITGFRGDICEGSHIKAKYIRELNPGTQIYRNISAAFEKEMEKNACERTIEVHCCLDISAPIHNDSTPAITPPADSDVQTYELTLTAESQDGRKVCSTVLVKSEKASNTERMETMIKGQLNKKSLHYNFQTDEIKAVDGLPLLRAAILNGLRRECAAQLEDQPCIPRPMYRGAAGHHPLQSTTLTYKANVSNRLSEARYRKYGATDIEPAYELTHRDGAELMRTKYCIKYELGLCPVRQNAKGSGPLFLQNNGRTFRLHFDCASCEMTVSQA